MIVVFIAGPFRGADAWTVEQNVRVAEVAAYQVANLGAMPLCPHTNTRFFDGTLTDEFWLEGTLELMRRCDVVLMVGGWRESSGALGEREEAKRLGLHVAYSIDELARWLEAERVRSIF
jgi:hypothetical protein